jgi:hypothetical protein
LQDRALQAVEVAGREIDDDLAAEGVAEQCHAREIHRVQPGRERVGQTADVEHLVGMAAVAEPGQVGQEDPVGLGETGGNRQHATAGEAKPVHEHDPWPPGDLGLAGDDRAPVDHRPAADHDLALLEMRVYGFDSSTGRRCSGPAP